MNRYFLSAALLIAAAPALAQSAIPPKKYSCYGSGHYLFMDITIKDGSNYADVEGKPGKYRYDPKTQAITFLSGSFQGSYAKYLGKTGIGLSSVPNQTFWATVCD